MLRQLKEFAKSLQDSKSVTIRFFFLILKKIWLGIFFIVKPSRRNYLLGKLKYSDTYMQPSTYTQSNRYPRVFQIVQLYFLEKFPLNTFPRILSFGCSTGEEVFSLGQSFPNSNIFGADINQWCLSQCKKKYADARFSFLDSQSASFNDLDNLDAIFCMAVLQHTDNRLPDTKKATAFTFQQFENILVELDKKLNINGLMIIDNTDFKFMDTQIADKYTILEVKGNKFRRTNRFTFDKNNNRIADEYTDYRVFSKQNNNN